MSLAIDLRGAGPGGGGFPAAPRDASPGALELDIQVPTDVRQLPHSFWDVVKRADEPFSGANDLAPLQDLCGKILEAGLPLPSHIGRGVLVAEYIETICLPHLGIVGKWTTYGNAKTHRENAKKLRTEIGGLQEYDRTNPCPTEPKASPTDEGAEKAWKNHYAALGVWKAFQEEKRREVEEMHLTITSMAPRHTELGAEERATKSGKAFAAALNEWNKTDRRNLPYDFGSAKKRLLHVSALRDRVDLAANAARKEAGWAKTLKNLTVYSKKAAEAMSATLEGISALWNGGSAALEYEKTIASDVAALETAKREFEESIRSKLAGARPIARRIAARIARGEVEGVEREALVRAISKLDAKDLALSAEEIALLQDAGDDLIEVLGEIEQGLPGSVRVLARVRRPIGEEGSSDLAISKNRIGDAYFNDVFDAESGTESIFGSFRSDVDAVAAKEGSALILTLGGSGSGKTYTVMGGGGEKGLIQCALEVLQATGQPVYVQITELFAKREGTASDQNELKHTQKIHSTWRTRTDSSEERHARYWLTCLGWEGNTVSNGAKVKAVHLQAELEKIERQRMENQRIQVTALNPGGSSRGHLFVRLSLDKEHVLTICDLAGLENPLQLAKDMGINSGDMLDLLRGGKLGDLFKLVAGTAPVQSLRSVHVDTVRRNLWRLRFDQAKLIAAELCGWTDERAKASVHAVKSEQPWADRPIDLAINMRDAFGRNNWTRVQNRFSVTEVAGAHSTMPTDSTYMGEGRFAVNMLMDSIYVTQTFNELRAFLIHQRSEERDIQELLGLNRVRPSKGRTYITRKELEEQKEVSGGEKIDVTMERVQSRLKSASEKEQRRLRDALEMMRAQKNAGRTYSVHRSWQFYSPDASISGIPAETGLIPTLDSFSGKDCKISVLCTFAPVFSKSKDTLEYAKRLAEIVPDSKKRVRGGAGV